MSRLHALTGHDTTPPAASPARQNTTLTPNRAGRVTENDQYAAC